MKWIVAIFSNIWKIYVGFIFCITAILLYPFFLIILRSKHGRTKSFRLFVLWSRMVQLFCLYPTQKKGYLKLPDEPHIILPNHTSYLDIFLMFSLFPKKPFLFMGKSEILGYPIIKTYFKNLNIPVDRSNKMRAGQSFLKAKEALQEGFSLVIFPEGGIPDLVAPKLGEFKDGAFLLAKKTNSPLIPVTFLNHHLLFSDPNNLLGTARPGLSKVEIHKAVYVENKTIDELKSICRASILSSLNSAEELSRRIEQKN